MLKSIALALGLNEDASEASCLSALGDLKKRVDPAIHEQTLKSLSLRPPIWKRSRGDAQGQDRWPARRCAEGQEDRAGRA